MPRKMFWLVDFSCTISESSEQLELMHNLEKLHTQIWFNEKFPNSPMKRESSTVHGGVGIHNSAELQTRKRYWLRAKFIIFRIFHLIWCCSSSCSFHLAWLFSHSAGFSINYDNNISTQHPASNKQFETNHRDFFDTVVFCVSVAMLAMSCPLFVRCSSCTGNSKQTAEIVLIPSAKIKTSRLFTSLWFSHTPRLSTLEFYERYAPSAWGNARGD